MTRRDLTDLQALARLMKDRDSRALAALRQEEDRLGRRAGTWAAAGRGGMHPDSDAAEARALAGYQRLSLVKEAEARQAREDLKPGIEVAFAMLKLSFGREAALKALIKRQSRPGRKR